MNDNAKADRLKNANETKAKNQMRELKKIYSACHEETYKVIKSNQEDKKSGIITGRDWDMFQSAASIYELVLGIVNSNEELFFIKTNTNKHLNGLFVCTNLGREVFLRVNHEVFMYYKDKTKPNPYIDLFIRNAMDKELNVLFSQGIEAMQIYGVDYLERRVGVLNEFISKIRTEAKSKQFKQSVEDYHRGSNKNYKGLVEYINALFERYSRLLVLRIDFGYGFRSPVEYPEAKRDREHFFSNMRSNATLFKHMVGHAWKLEYGRDKGFHYHIIFFFDGSQVREDVTRAKMIGEYWTTTITQGRGLYYNCNAKKDSYRHCGVGMVNHNDNELRENLITKAVIYLTKTDYYAKIAVPVRDKTFSKGVKPKPKTSKAGRPRKSKTLEKTTL